jgi:hypothetical protein
MDDGQKVSTHLIPSRFSSAVDPIFLPIAQHHSTNSTSKRILVILFPGIPNRNTLEARVEFQNVIPHRLLAPSRDGYQPCPIRVFAEIGSRKTIRTHPKKHKISRGVVRLPKKKKIARGE